jgi:hypothetical protein
VLLFAHPNFFHSLRQSFILPSYLKASAIALAALCSIPPFPEPRTHYHPSVEIFIDDEAKKASI